MLNRTLAAFLQEGLGIHIGACNERLEPNGARALAVTVDEDGTHLEVFLAEVAAARLIPDLNANGNAAVSFGRPIDDRACQVKGVLVAVRPAEPHEREPIRRSWRLSCRVSSALEFPAPAPRTGRDGPPSPCD